MLKTHSFHFYVDLANGFGLEHLKNYVNNQVVHKGEMTEHCSGTITPLIETSRDVHSEITSLNRFATEL